MTDKQAKREAELKRRLIVLAACLGGGIVLLALILCLVLGLSERGASPSDPTMNPASVSEPAGTNGTTLPTAPESNPAATTAGGDAADGGTAPTFDMSSVFMAEEIPGAMNVPDSNIYEIFITNGGKYRVRYTAADTAAVSAAMKVIRDFADADNATRSNRDGYDDGFTVTVITNEPVTQVYTLFGSFALRLKDVIEQYPK